MQRGPRHNVAMNSHVTYRPSFFFSFTRFRGGAGGGV